MPRDVTSWREEVQSFCARVLHLCEYVQDASSTTDLLGVKDDARRLHTEAHEISDMVMPK